MSLTVRAVWQRLCSAITAVAVVACLMPVTAQSQSRQPPPARGQQLPRPDTGRIEFVFTGPDSIMTELLARRGYRRIEYQGNRVQFDAQTRLLRLTGDPSAVRRDETLLIGDTIVYNDSTKKVVALGDTVVLRDPTQQGSDDFVVQGRLEYDLESRSGLVGAFSTSFVSGQRLFMSAERGAMITDSLVPGGGHIVYARNGSFTYCDHAEPHFHFTTREMKFISENIMVARPGVLYIGEVPVFWIPFFFQDVRSGRRSGILTPNFGIAELVRNSPSYRRSVSNIGYYFAINDYMDAQASFDWRSGAGGNAFDPGFLRGNMEWRYRWLNRFITGHFAASYLTQRDGRTNTSYTLNHAQDFSRFTKLTASLNWTQSTDIQRQTTINPIAANATIYSQVNYQTRIGPAQINAGGSRRQYPGRTQVDMDFPSLSVTTGTLGGERLQWTPSLRLAMSSQSRIDQGLQFPFVYNPRPTGGIDSSRFRANRNRTTIGFETPIKIFDFVWQNSFSYSDELRDYPEQRQIIGVRDTSDRITRVYARTFETNFDWTTSFSLPRFFQGSWNMSPNINIGNVDPASGLFVRTERSGGQWVQQSKRLSYGLSASPTLYKIFDFGIGPIARFRHAIAPSFSYSYSPRANVSDEYLAALGRTRVGYLGSLAQNRVSMNLSTNIEARLRAAPPVVGDSSLAMPDQDAGRKLTLLSLNFSPLTYDFVRADSTGNGFTDRTFSISGRTDLLPGLDFRTSYELFQGDPLSDTATFKPFRTDIAVGFSLNNRSGIFALLGRLIGRRPTGDSIETTSGSRSQAALDDARQVAQSNAAGAGQRNIQLALPATDGWNWTIQYNAARQRPPRGGTQISNDPAALCESQRVLGPFAFEQCVQQAQNTPPTGLNSGQSAIGAPFFLSPPTQNVTSALTFAFTRNWSAQWSTQYDVTRSQFASQQVSLQRQLHDWNAVFAFTQAPNGNFAFNFFIALKAQPELKFNYDRQTFRQPGF